MGILMDQLLKILKSRNPALLFVSGFISRFGDWFYFTAILSLIYSKDGLVVLSAYTVARQILPILFTPYAGLLSDRINKKYLMIGTDILNGTLMLILSILLFVGSTASYAIMVLAIASSLVSVAFRAARGSLLPHTVNERDRIYLNSTEGLVSTLCMIVAPLIGGVIAAGFNHQIVFFLNGISFFVSAIIVSFLKYESQSENEVRQQLTWRESFQGIQYILKEPSILGLIFLYSISHIGIGGTWLLLPILAKGYGTLPDLNLGILTAVLGLGSMLGMLAGIRTQRLWPYLAFALCFIVCIYSNHFILSSAGIFLLGLTANMTEPPFWTTIQKRIPGGIYGRAFAAIDALALAGISLGAALSGSLMNQWGYKQGIYILVFLLVISQLSVYAVFRRHLTFEKGNN